MIEMLKGCTVSRLRHSDTAVQNVGRSFGAMIREMSSRSEMSYGPGASAGGEDASIVPRESKSTEMIPSLIVERKEA